jgi:FkbM family methyltransferase
MKRPLIRYLRALLPRLGVRSVTHCVHGRRYRVPLACTSLRHWFRTEDVPHEGSFYGQVLALAQPGDVVFDIGAHLGKYVVGFADRLQGQGTIVAFEANPVTAAHLDEIVSLNGLSDLVRVVHAAVGQQAGILSMTIHGDGCDAAQSLAAGAGPAVEVRMTTVDRFVEESGLVPRLIKIDVEGYELKVLEGARQTLLEHAPVVCCEIHPRQLDALGASAPAVERFLADAGYDAPEGRHCHRPGDDACPYDIVFHSRRANAGRAALAA